MSDSKFDCRVIGTINPKGGVGKTTTAIYLGMAFTAMGKKVVVIDLDRQGSATDWADRAAEDEGTPLPFDVEISNSRRIKSFLEKLDENTIAILDTPPGDPESIDTAIQVSDFVVIPTRSYGIESARMWDTLPFMDGIPHAVLITSARLGTTSLEAFMGILDAEEVPRFRAGIPLRESIPATWGRLPGNLHGYDHVAKSILDRIK